IPGVPCEGACVFTDKWALYELANGLPGDGPYQTFLPSLDDIITLVCVDREGPVTRVRHKKEIDVIEYGDPEFSDPYAVLTKHLYGVLTIFNLIRHMALPPRDQRYQYLRYEGLQYTKANIVDFESRLARIYRREVHRVQVFDFGGLPNLMAGGLSARMLMEHKGVSLFTSRAWRRLFDIREPWRYLSWRQFIVALGLHTGEEMESLGFARYWAESARQIPDRGDLRDYWIGISPAGDFLSTTPSYTMIRDPILRLCHRLIACSIAGRSQAPEKGLTVIAPALSVIDMAELVILHIYEQLDDTWAWVAMGPERQPDAAFGAPRVAQDTPVIDEGGHADPAPVPAPPPPPPAAARTMPQRMAKLEEDMHKIRGTLAE
ncbi:hypothetical protein Tco_1470835, partial [Tanacetum coccineum]